MRTTRAGARNRWGAAGIPCGRVQDTASSNEIQVQLMKDLKGMVKIWRISV